MKPLQAQHADAAAPIDSSGMEARRVPLERKVILKFHHFGGFFIEYSANISMTGMFIKTDAPKPAGSVFIFEIWLGEEYKLVHGLGEVVWTREDHEGDDRPAGMGVHFLKVDDESLGVVARIISEHVQKGGEIFDLRLGARTADSSIKDGEGAVSSVLGARPIQDSELLVINEEELQLRVPLKPEDVESQADSEAPRSVSKPGRIFRIVALLGALAAALGGLAYLVSAEMLPF